MTYPTISENPQVQSLYEEIRTSGEEAPPEEEPVA